MASRAMTMYIQYRSRNDFSRAASTGLPSAVTGGGTRSAGLERGERTRAGGRWGGRGGGQRRYS